MDVFHFLAVSNVHTIVGCESENGGTAQQISCNLVNTEYHMLNVHPFAMKNIRHIVSFWIVWIRSLFSHLNTFSFWDREEKKKKYEIFTVCRCTANIANDCRAQAIVVIVWFGVCEMPVYLNQFGSGPHDYVPDIGTHTHAHMVRVVGNLCLCPDHDAAYNTRMNIEHTFHLFMMTIQIIHYARQYAQQATVKLNDISFCG